MDHQELRRLGKILRGMYDNPVSAVLTKTGKARTKTRVQLFGILYAKEIERCGESLAPTAREIVKHAGIPEYLHMDITRGRLLAEYVTVNDRRVLKWRD